MGLSFLIVAKLWVVNILFKLNVLSVLAIVDFGENKGCVCKHC